MYRRGQVLLVGLLLAVFLPLSAYSKPGDGDIWPWPWGQECPFPWKDIDGLWKITNRPNAGYFRFKLRKTEDKEGYLIKIDHIDKNGEPTASGSGFASYSQKIVRAALHSTIPGRDNSYWLIARAYEVDEKVGCSGNIQTVVTLRPTGADQDWELNYEIEQVQFDLERIPQKVPGTNW